MFKYLWMVIQDLFLTVTYATLMHSMLSRAAGRQGRLFHGTALCAGVLASVALAAVIPAAAPVGASVTMFSVRHGGDGRFPSALVAVSTLMSILTMPVVIGFARYLLGVGK